MRACGDSRTRDCGTGLVRVGTRLLGVSLVSRQFTRQLGEPLPRVDLLSTAGELFFFSFFLHNMSHPNPNERIQVDVSSVCFSKNSSSSSNPFQTSDDDSLFDTESVVDSNLSFASSVQDYAYENGRRYHAYRHGQYPFPNDEEEQDRLALMHHLFKLLSGGDLYRAPLTPHLGNENGLDHQHQTETPCPTRILDIGTGTGDWALDMAEDFPDAEILGTDLSPIQPNWAPPNCRFFVDDAESVWTFSPDEAFDYIHARSMGGGIGDWPRLLRQCYSHLKPGGWFEAQEFEAWVLSDDGSHESAVAVMDWQDRLNAASAEFGKPMNVAPRIAAWLEDEGFVNVQDDIYKVRSSPQGIWACGVSLLFIVSCWGMGEESSTQRDRPGGQTYHPRSCGTVHLGSVYSGAGLLVPRCPGVYGQSACGAGEQ